jgi:hypothetical protein
MHARAYVCNVIASRVFKDEFLSYDNTELNEATEKKIRNNLG